MGAPLLGHRKSLTRQRPQRKKIRIADASSVEALRTRLQRINRRAPIEVVEDELGVPHVRAASLHDALTRLPHRVAENPKLGAVARECLHLDT